MIVRLIEKVIDYREPCRQRYPEGAWCPSWRESTWPRERRGILCWDYLRLTWGRGGYFSPSFKAALREKGLLICCLEQLRTVSPSLLPRLAISETCYMKNLDHSLHSQVDRYVMAIAMDVLPTLATRSGFMTTKITQMYHTLENLSF